MLNTGTLTEQLIHANNYVTNYDCNTNCGSDSRLLTAIPFRKEVLTAMLFIEVFVNLA